ncbi:hypothetical protein FITA111629_05220 [Filibacter tadaridae]|uniref:Uncharacterized protein n=1 Tax=Filibacter tadaridae TaxID=2483811 RepID=A0A3P5WRX0_9BACL|nr:hypothetical protein FILTAD_00926 [Filibacter tadaridae]
MTVPFRFSTTAPSLFAVSTPYASTPACAAACASTRPAPCDMTSYLVVSRIFAVLESATLTSNAFHVGFACLTSAAIAAICGVAMEVPVLRSYDWSYIASGKSAPYCGIVDMIFVPGALTSGLMSKFGVDGPRELESLTSSPVVADEANSPNVIVPAPFCSAARMASPSVTDISNVGMNSNESPRNVPDSAGALVPPAKLWMIAAIAPFSLAAAILSTKAISPREINATFPLTSISL